MSANYWSSDATKIDLTFVPPITIEPGQEARFLHSPDGAMVGVYLPDPDGTFYLAAAYERVGDVLICTRQGER